MTTPAESGSNKTDRRGIPGAGAAMVADQPVLLVRHRAGIISQASRTVHLVRMPTGCETGVAAALCGGLLCREDMEVVEPGQGVPCQVCLMNQTSALTAGVVPDAVVPAQEQSFVADFNGNAGFPGGPAYQAWGWPVSAHRGLIQLRLDCDASAIAIPIPISAEVTQVLTTRHCVPAVLAHPYAPEHHMVLTGERFGATLPWPSGVYEVTGAVMLPPTKTLYGRITWVQPPSQDSLRLSREIDVFGALRTVLSQ
ncbi:MAG TPA: hypothetical protein VN748_11820 [Pseudonocardiaceae bacterium]|jgi:hypothetical protein|nr:hypothetical protein [Pseudonocardiaceae bacterium]